MGPGSSTMQEHDAANNEDDGMPEWDDDDLIAMQAEPMVRAFLLRASKQTHH